MISIFRYILLFLLCSLGTTPVLGQTNFRAGWKKSDPVAPESALALEEKVKAHRDFINSATLEKDSLKQLYGLLYLFQDYLDVHNYSEASRYLLEAESIANASGNLGGKVGSRTERVFCFLFCKIIQRPLCLMKQLPNFAVLRATACA